MNAPPTYVCQQFVEDLTAYLEGALPDDVVRLIEQHLALCPPCIEYLDQMRRTIATTRAVGASDVDAMPAGVRDRLIRAFTNQVADA